MPSDSGISPRIIVILTIPVILFILMLAVSSTPITPHQMDLQIQEYQKDTLNTESLKGKILYVEFFATWCIGCKEITENMKSVLSNNSFNNQDDFVVLSVSVDSHDTDPILTQFINLYGLSNFTNSGQWIFGRDNQEQRVLYNVALIPHSFIVAKNGTILDDHVGITETNTMYSWIELARSG